MISVVIPTVRGRERLLDGTQAAFEDTATTELQFVVVRNEMTVGAGWNKGAERATGDFLMLAGDDFIPEPGWDETAIAAAWDDVYPAPWIKCIDGTTESYGSLGQGLLLSPTAKDKTPVYNSPIPFMRREKWDTIGPSLPIHYYADDYLAYRARFTAGLDVEVRKGYCFTHLDGQPGKPRNVAKGQEYRWEFAKAVSEL